MWPRATCSCLQAQLDQSQIYCFHLMVCGAGHTLLGLLVRSHSVPNGQLWVARSPGVLCSDVQSTEKSRAVSQMNNDWTER